MKDNSKPPFVVIDGGKHDEIESDESIPGTEAHDALHTRLFFKRHPNADFEPAAVGRGITGEQRKRDLLWNDEDIISAHNDPQFLMKMFDLRFLDRELRRVIDPALESIADLHQYGRVTMPGLGVGVLKTALKNNAAFDRYFQKPNEWPRPSAEVQAEIDNRMPDALQWLRRELEEALKKEKLSDK
jgi:hypothetical protein